jgi:hypothetical protein
MAYLSSARWLFFGFFPGERSGTRFHAMERRQLRERREGKYRRALGMPDESVEELARLGEEDRVMTEQGLMDVPIT